MKYYKIDILVYKTIDILAYQIINNQSIPEANKKCCKSGTTLIILKSENNSSYSSWFWQFRIKFALKTKMEAANIGRTSSDSNPRILSQRRKIYKKVRKSYRCEYFQIITYLINLQGSNKCIDDPWESSLKWINTQLVEVITHFWFVGLQ